VSPYRIVIDRSVCSGFGTCAEIAPDLVEVGPDGIASARVGVSDDPRVHELVASCPMAAIEIVDESSDILSRPR
jgi:ferredoxin